MSYIKHRSNDFTKEELDYKNYSEDLDHTTRNESRENRRKLLLQFASSLATQMRGIKFAHKDYRSLFVFMEGELMCMGWIGYGDYQVTTTPDELSYVVYSRHIDNQKYSYDNEQHYMRQSINESTAIKNCKKYLRNYNTIEMADLDLSKVKASATKKVVKMSNDAESEIGKVLDVNRYRPQIVLCSILCVMHSTVVSSFPTRSSKINSLTCLKCMTSTCPTRVTRSA